MVSFPRGKFPLPAPWQPTPTPPAPQTSEASIPGKYCLAQSGLKHVTRHAGHAVIYEGVCGTVLLISHPGLPLPHVATKRWMENTERVCRMKMRNGFLLELNLLEVTRHKFCWKKNTNHQPVVCLCDLRQTVTIQILSVDLIA